MHRRASVLGERVGHLRRVGHSPDAVNRGDAHGPIAELVKDGGKVATTTGVADVDRLNDRGVGATNLFAQSDPGPFARILEMAGQGKLVVPITRTFVFDELPQALGLVGTRSSRGKFGITITG